MDWFRLARNFRFERGHHDVSIGCAERVMVPAIRRADLGTLVVADGFSRRTQIEHTTGRRAIHLAQVLDPRSLAMSRMGEHPVHPTGQQLELRRGEQRAVAVEVGGALRFYIAFERELLDGYDAAERCTSARGQSLIPWPNRLRDGRYKFEGTDYQLPLTEPAEHNAIHGLVWWAMWTPADRTETPFPLRCS